MRPKSESAYLLLTALTPVSHHDPAVSDGSNVLTFNRQKQFVAHAGGTGAGATQAVIDNFCALTPVPASLAELFGSMGFAEFVATAMIKELIDIYNGYEGVGLFSGLGRYDLLESRARIAAVKSSNLWSFWSNLVRDLQLPIHPGKQDDSLTLFFSLPGSVQFSVVNQIAVEYRTVITVARVWHSKEKLMSEAYAKAAGLFADAADELRPMTFVASENAVESSLVLDVPAVSANSLRHQVVREPGWLHLFGTLGLEGEKLPAEAEAIFFNGGNIRAGAKQPTNAYALARKARKAYPFLDLMGGVCDSFDLGESMLSISAWLVCRENAAALPASASHLPGASVSAFDLLDDITHTRQATEQGVGQMIYNFETLVPGTQFVVRLATKPYINQLAMGALAAAVDTYLGCHPTIAGQSARGFGVVGAEWLDRLAGFDQSQAEYEKYLEENRDALRGWILDGTLGTGVPVVS